MAALVTLKLSLLNMCLNCHLWCRSIRKVTSLSLTKLFSHGPCEAGSWHFNVNRNGKFLLMIAWHYNLLLIETWIVWQKSNMCFFNWETHAEFLANTIGCLSKLWCCIDDPEGSKNITVYFLSLFHL